jgi:hypothetical protein
MQQAANGGQGGLVYTFHIIWKVTGSILLKLSIRLRRTTAFISAGNSGTQYITVEEKIPVCVYLCDWHGRQVRQRTGRRDILGQTFNKESAPKPTPQVTYPNRASPLPNPLPKLPPRLPPSPLPKLLLSLLPKPLPS